MDADDSFSDQAEAYVALVHKEIQRLNEQLGEGEGVEAIYPLPNGTHLSIHRFGFQNPSLIKLTGVDSEGRESSLVVHKQQFLVVLRKSATRTELSLQTAFQDPNRAQQILFDQTA